MGQSYRIKTELGINKTINVELDQDFEFLEILSLKIQQADVYTRSCADYGVIVGRVTANNGFGIPNARVSIFIPITDVDESNPIISSIYPYKSPTDKNEDGYRYNLLPYEKSYSVHAATGTLPTRDDVLTDSVAVQIYDKYYRYTTKTNESGDYMIMGVPLGSQTLVMDVDLSDIGEFSLTPQDLIRMGLATESQVAGNTFRSSNDLTSLPQIISLTKTLSVSPLWGDPEICQIAVNRVDFDLRDEANIDIQPTSVFMGSIFSTTDRMRLRSNCRPRDNMGNLCSMIAGPGQILAIRQTIQQDSGGNPILEQYLLEQSGNVIDGSGAWLVELPMNLDYFTTNEFGEKVISNDPTIGIPTKGKYRFKVKWQQSPSLSQQNRRANFLIPNVREYGWSTSDNDPNYSGNITVQNKLKSSYYFGLDWNGYAPGGTTGFTSTERIQKLDEIIDCQDTFYEFKYNRVYTVSNLIDEYKKGGRANFIGIKEVDDSSCESTINKFPVNDGFKNFNLFFFIFSILMQVLQIISIPLLIVIHVLAFVWNTLVKFKDWFIVFMGILIGYYGYMAIKRLIEAGKATKDGGILAAASAAAYAGIYTSGLGSFFAKLSTTAFLEAKNLTAQATEYGIIAGKLALLLTAFIIIFNLFKGQPIRGFQLPVITYPDCISCECGTSSVDAETSSAPLGTLMTQFSNNFNYYNNFVTPINQLNITTDPATVQTSFSIAMGGNSDVNNDNQVYKVMESPVTIITSGSVTNDFFAYSNYYPFGERINNFNLRQKYFAGVNRIRVSFDNSVNSHYDNTLVIIYDTPIQSGTLLTFVDPLTTKDVNATYTGNTGSYNRGISGTSLNSGASTYTVNYCDPNNQLNNLSVNYQLNTGSTQQNYKYPSDVEYFQVITGMTVQEASTMWDTTTDGLLPNIMESGTVILYSKLIEVPPVLFNNNPAIVLQPGYSYWEQDSTPSYKTSDLFEDFSQRHILILQRGVDPYSPIYTNTYGLGKLFGLPNEDSLIMTANTRLNIPIQKLPDNSISVQKFNSQSDIFYPSHFFRGGISGSNTPGLTFSSFTTSIVGYYGSYDASNAPPSTSVSNVNGVNIVSSLSSNDTWTSVANEPGRYKTSEDLSGGAYYYTQGGISPTDTTITYYTKVLYPSLLQNPMSITSNTNNVMRTDRLPSSDVLDGSSWDYNPSLLQQNLGFAVYVIDDAGIDIQATNYSLGADITTENIEGQYASTNVFNTFTKCSEVVSIECYEGIGTDFQVNQNCVNSDAVIDGCYQFLREPLTDIGKDIDNFNEWAFRWRFFYGLCQGVLSQSFVNNWVNGGLYMYPIQIDTIFDSQNRPLPPSFCRDTIYFEKDTNNFYYRSSPYNEFLNKFIGNAATQVGSLNKLNLQSPTTIINLGMKDSFYDEIILGEGDTSSYVMRQMEPTTYSDPSDLVNLFVISRITNESFLQRMLGGGDSGINQLFSRGNLKIDGDLAQLLSINSELGVIKFSPEYYQLVQGQVGPVEVLGTPQYPVVAVWFSSTTEDLQVKDYLTPGRINFRVNNNANYYPYPYGIKSQVVPFYQWSASGTTIFGTEDNNWATDYADIVQGKPYQSLDRTSLSNPNYFRPTTSSVSDLYARGYIFSVDANGNYSTTGASSSRFIVGAPFHFYFGLINGETALDKFKTKYSIDE
jgi:hypothetical protein